ncbi:MAG: hypothetical protein PVJ07_09645, partial [Anaerolineales bacterium]
DFLPIGGRVVLQQVEQSGVGIRLVGKGHCNPSSGAAWRSRRRLVLHVVLRWDDCIGRVQWRQDSLFFGRR